jgi:uncharacterized membrane protein
MQSFYWNWAATPGASLIVGIFGLVLLLAKRCHRDNRGKISRQKISAALLLAAAAYTMMTAVIGQFFLGIPLSQTIKHGFGDQRIAWLLVFLVVDMLARYLRLFDPAAAPNNGATPR